MKLKKWVEEAGVNFMHLANFLEVDRSYIYMIRKGIKKPSSRLLKRIEALTGGKVQTFEDLQDG